MNSVSPQNFPVQGFIPLPSPWVLQDGGELLGAQVFYERFGEPSPSKDNVILLFTGLSASAHAHSHPLNSARGWWEEMIGPNLALDTTRFCVLVINSLGSCFGSTGPGSIAPTSGEKYGFGFPTLRIEDIARAAQAAVSTLGIEQLYATIGMSLGGMSVLAHRLLYPSASQRLVCISGALAASSYAVATRSLQREILGRALQKPQDDLSIQQAIKWARKIGILSYIGADLLEKRFHRDQNEPYSGNASGTDFEVEGWLEHLATRFSTQFDPYSYWTLSRAMDLFSFSELNRRLYGNDSVQVGQGKALVIGVHEDLLFPLQSQAEVAATLRQAKLQVQFEQLHSAYGHDAFLAERRLFEPSLQGFLAT